jgi:hypothetical protein
MYFDKRGTKVAPKRYLSVRKYFVYACLCLTVTVQLLVQIIPELGLTNAIIRMSVEVIHVGCEVVSGRVVWALFVVS